MRESRVRHHLTSIEEHVRKLERLRRMPESEFTQNPRHPLVAAKILTMALDCLFWACEELCAGEFSGAAAIQEVGRLGVLSPDFTWRLQDMSSLRDARRLCSRLEASLALKRRQAQADSNKAYRLLGETQYLSQFAKSVRNFLAG